jgi:single-strand DNA-binding protein
LLGHVGQDAEVKTFGDSSIANFSLATNEYFTNREGEKVVKTEWHRVVVTNSKLAEVAGQYVRRGERVYLEGRLQTRKWEDNNGQVRYITEVVVPPVKGDLKVLFNKREGSEGGEDSSVAEDKTSFDIPF